MKILIFITRSYSQVLLTGGAEATIKVQSILADPTITLWGSNEYNALEEPLFDDDSGGGIFGTDSAIVFEVPVTDYYVFGVDDNLFWVGEYVVTATEKK